jgi:hypothetical protein
MRKYLECVRTDLLVQFPYIEGREARLDVSLVVIVIMLAGLMPCRLLHNAMG